jgi:hypothetical protein
MGDQFRAPGELIFASWFTYDGTGKPIWFSTALEQQATAASRARSTRRMAGFRLGAFDATRVTHTTVGTARVSFSDATHGTLTLTLGGVAQIKPLTLFVFARAVSELHVQRPGRCGWSVNYQDMWFVAWREWLGHPRDASVRRRSSRRGSYYDASGNPTWVSASRSTELRPRRTQARSMQRRDQRSTRRCSIRPA